MTLYLLRYNNYYNRRAKRLQTLQEYRQFELQAIPGVNFNPNDGVSTQVLLNITQTPDYIVCSQDNQTIDSRWFVLEDTRTRGGQYKLILYRDTIADYWGDITHAPMFVQKGMLTIDDTFLLNEQPGNFNQIRKSQKRLFDESRTPWIVGYIPQDMFNEDDPNTRTLTIPARTVAPTAFDYTAAQLQAETGGHMRFFDSDAFRTEVLLENLPNGNKFFTGVDYIQTFRNSNNEIDSETISAFSPSPSLICSTTNITGEHIDDEIRRIVMEAVVTERLSKNIKYTDALYTLRNSFGVYDHEKYSKFTDAINGLNGKTVYNEQTGVLSRIIVSNYESQYVNGTTLAVLEQTETITKLISGYQEALGVYYSERIQLAGRDIVATWQKNVNGFDGRTIKLFTGTGIEITFEQLTSAKNITLTFPKATNRIKCKDQPYDIFCIPYYEFSNSRGQYVYGEGSTLKPNKGIVLNLMQRLPALVGTSAIYDVQILPYCPLDVGRYATYDNIDVIKCGPEYGDTPIKQEGKTIGWISWLRKSNFEFQWRLDGFEFPTDPMVAKVKGTTSFIRLAANNFSKFFDFNPIKNKGVAKLKIACTYKPYSPFIKVTPVWNRGGLYATQPLLADPRGLITAGDMSIAQVTDRWADYQLNNKNYLSIFDRQIQNMEFNRNWGQGAAGVAAAAGTVAGGVAGAALGSMAGGIGAVPGAVLGAAGGALTGGADVASNWIIQNEAIDYTKDLFQYQLGNIKALPQGLAKTAAQVIIDSYIPTLEQWCATVTEQKALQNKIKYNGMTVQRIDYLYNFLPQGGYFKAQIIRLPESFTGETHMANAIAKELNKGIYLT